MPHPVVVVLSEHQADCQRVVETYRRRAHVICSLTGKEAPPAEGTDAERELFSAMEHLKNQAPALVARSPVHLFASTRYARVGAKMLVKEPSVFAYAYLAGLEPSYFTAARFLKLADGGARIVLIDQKFPPRSSLQLRRAETRDLWVYGIGSVGRGLERAARTFVRADPRLAQLP